MKYWFGYLVAAIIGALTWVLQQFGARFSTLIDMVYPYVIRTLQGILAEWSGSVDFLLWQLLAVALAVVILASLVAVIAAKRSVISWGGWVLSALSFVYLLHTLVWGLNYHAGPLSDDIRMDVAQYTLEELVEATEYYRDRANVLSRQVKRDDKGYVDFPEFETMSSRAYMGYQRLVYDRSYPIFAGSALPVKRLGWADMYTSMGITGVTFGLTGEAAVNPQIPEVLLPFTMCHEMAHRMCIASERDANFAAFLACSVHPDLEFEYSAYFMAYRYCYNAIASVQTVAAVQAASDVAAGVEDDLYRDLVNYDNFFRTNKDEAATAIADSANDAYLRTSGETAGIASYSQVCDLLVNWHIQEVVLPSIAVEESRFDPYDETQVDISDIR
ncbi:MAG: DUF3810 domain-containing protein [Oscillospiraceae bacterium]|nr:DUF3810 domain-containing protein [Oscillospiraceae bacterium]